MPVRNGSDAYAWEPCYQSDETTMLESASFPVFAADENAVDRAWDDLVDPILE